MVTNLFVAVLTMFGLLCFTGPGGFIGPTLRH